MIMGNVATTSPAPMGPQSVVYCPTRGLYSNRQRPVCRLADEHDRKHQLIPGLQNVKMAIVASDGFISGV